MTTTDSARLPWQDVDLDAASMDFDEIQQVTRATAVADEVGSLGRQLLRQRMFPEHSEITRIGRYVLSRFVGAGGMGQVFAGYDPVLDRKVAIKLLGSQARGSVEQRTRMLREAQAMAKLSHPNVVQIYEAGEHDGQIYMAMELVEGQTLAAWLAADAGRPLARAIVDKFVEAGRGLAAAHEAGLVHRDFKPSNVIIDPQGCARVLDFGLVAGSAGQAEPSHPPTLVETSASQSVRALDVELTTTGTLLGTPAYMAPEQFVGGKIDARTDQFGFCVALFEALTGERPFVGSTMAELSQSVSVGRRTNVRIRGLSRAAVRAIERGMSVSADARWPNMPALLDALGPRSRRRVWGAVSLALLPILGVSSWKIAERYQEQLDDKSHELVSQHLARRELERERERGSNLRLLTVAHELRGDPQRAITLLREFDFDVPHDHSRWSAVTADHLAAVIVPTQVLEPQQVGTIGSLKLSADSRLLMLSGSRDARIWRLAADGQPATELDLGQRKLQAAAMDPQHPGQIAVAGEGWLELRDVDAGSVLQTFTADDLTFRTLEFSPDAGWLLGRIGLSGDEARLWSSDGRTIATLHVPQHGHAYSYALSPDGRTLAGFFIDDNTVALWRLDAIEQGPTLMSGPREQLATAASFAPDGRLAVAYRSLVGQPSVRMWTLADGDATPERELVGHADAIFQLAFDPDGRTLLSVSVDHLAQIWELDSGRTRLVHDVGAKTVEFMADGRRFVTGSSDTVKIWPTDSSAPPLVLPGTAPSSSTDGKTVAVAAGSRVLIYDLDARTEVPPVGRPLDIGPFYNPKLGEFTAVDPSGRWVAAMPTDNRIHVWDTRACPECDVWATASVIHHESSSDLRLAITPDRRVAAGTYSGRVWTWGPDDDTGVEIGELGGDLLGLRFDPMGTRLLAFGKRGIAKLWTLNPNDQAPPEPRSLTPQAAWIRAAAFSPDGRSWATAAGHTIHLWHEQADAPIVLDGHSGYVNTLEFDPTCTRLLTASDDHSARVWSVTDGRELIRLDAHEGPVNSAHFNADASSIVTASSDHGARVFPLDGGPPLRLDYPHTVEDAAFSPTGALLIATSDATAYIVRFDGAGHPQQRELAGNGASMYWHGQMLAFSLESESAPDVERVAWVAGGASALVLTRDSVWIWDADYSFDELLTWMWRSLPACPNTNWRSRNLGLDREQAQLASTRCEAMVACTRTDSYSACKPKLRE